MLILDNTPIGPCVVFMAPKTGATSLSEIAIQNGANHRIATWSKHKKEWVPDFHEVHGGLIGERKIVLTVRDPRERWLSLWRHYCNGKRTDISFEHFVKIQPSVETFYECPLWRWYAVAIHRKHELIRLESFAEDVERLLGWKQQVHVNKTQHPPWEDYAELINDHYWWREDARIFGYGSPAAVA